VLGKGGVDLASTGQKRLSSGKERGLRLLTGGLGSSSGHKLKNGGEAEKLPVGLSGRLVMQIGKGGVGGGAVCLTDTRERVQ